MKTIMTDAAGIKLAHKLRNESLAKVHKFRSEVNVLRDEVRELTERMLNNSQSLCTLTVCRWRWMLTTGCSVGSSRTIRCSFRSRCRSGWSGATGKLA